MSWAYSTCGERYEGAHESREEALAEARAVYEGEEGTVYTGQAVAPPVGEWAEALAHAVIEGLAERAYEEVGDVADGWLRVTHDDEAALGRRLRAAVESWLSESGHVPDWWCVRDVREHHGEDDAE